MSESPADSGATSYVFGPIRVEVGSRQVWRDGNPVVIASKAFDALIYLAARPDRTGSFTSGRAAA